MKTRQLIFLMIILGLFLRFYSYDSQSIWCDEVHTQQVSKTFFDFMPKYLGYETNFIDDLSLEGPHKSLYFGLNQNMPLYFFITAITTRLLGNNLLALRFPAIIAGVFAIFFIFLLGKELFGDKVGLLSAFIFAINPYQLYFAQEGRVYSLFLLLALISCYYFYMALKENKTLYWVTYIIATTFCFYSHLFTVLILFFQFLFAIYSYRNKNRIIKYVISQLILFLFFLPWSLIIFYQILSSKSMIITETFNFIDIPAAYIVFAIGQTIIRKDSGGLLQMLTLFLFSLSFLLPLIKYALTKFKTFTKKDLFLILYMIIPVITLYIVAIFTNPLMFQWRYCIIAAPAFYILTAKGILSFKSKYWQNMILLILVGLCLWSLINYYTMPAKPDNKGIADYLAASKQSGDLLLVYNGYLEHAVNYYYPNLIQGIGREFDGYLSSQNWGQLGQAAETHNRIWVMFTHTGNRQKLIEFLSKDFKITQDKDYLGARLLLFEKI